MKSISLEHALERILTAFQPLDAHDTPVTEADGLVLAQDVRAPHPLPPFANSAMDGFAVRVADLATARTDAPVVLPVAATVQAGEVLPTAVPPASVVRIMTGACLPAGADAVVPIEEISEQADGSIAFFTPTTHGNYVRPVGEDIPAGDVALPHGTMLKAAEIGLLAALGITRVAVVRRPRVALFSSGDELRTVDQPLTPGTIYDANGPALTTFLAQQGAIPLWCGIARDRVADVQAKIDRARQQQADLILASAGASVGDYDVVRQCLSEQDSLELWRVNIKPGRPLLYGRIGDPPLPLIGLPGNPVSALVVAELLLKPVLDRMRGLLQSTRILVPAVLDAPQPQIARRHYVRASLNRDTTTGTYHATTQGIALSSGALTSLVRANALLIIPEGTGELPAGSVVDAMVL